MPLSLRFSRGSARWKLCSAGSRHRVMIEWRELDGNSPPPKIEYKLRVVSWFFLLPIEMISGVLEPRRNADEPEPADEPPGEATGEEGSAVDPSPAEHSGEFEGERRHTWTASYTVTAGHLLTRYVKVHVPRRQDPPQEQKLWLIPVASVWVSVSMLLLLLAGSAVLLATMLSTLHLNLTYAHAVSGLSGLSLLVVAGLVFRRISPELRGDRPPLLGLGYMFGRTALTCLLALVAIAVLPSRLMTMVVNRTKTEVRLDIPELSRTVVLGPDQRATFVMTPKYLGEALGDELEGEEGRPVCLVDAEGQALVPSCEPEQPPSSEKAHDDTLLRGLEPVPLDIRCREQRWDELDQQTFEGARAGTAAPQVQGSAFADLDRRVMRLDESCRVKDSARALVTLADPHGFSTHYDVPYGWTPAELRDAPRLVMSSNEDRTTRLRIATERGNESSGEQSPGSSEQVVLGVDAPPGSGHSAPIAVPRVGMGELEITIGTPSGEGLTEHGLVKCTPDEVTSGHFRLGSLTVPEGSTSRLLALRASTADSPSWSSSWQNMRRGNDNALPPWICAIASGSGHSGQVTAPSTLGRVSLTFEVDLPQVEEPLTIRVPDEYVGDGIEIVANDGLGTRATGILHCHSSSPVEAFDIGPLWIRDTKNRLRSDIFQRMTIEGRGPESETRADSRRGGGSARRWSSVWQLGNERPSLFGGNFPPWVCRPASTTEGGCLGCGRAMADSSEGVKAIVVNGRDHWSADVMLPLSMARQHPTPPTICYTDRYFSRVYTSKKCQRSHPCKSVSPERHRHINDDLGLEGRCSVIIPCPKESESCPES